jgi:hypothetical protein
MIFVGDWAPQGDKVLISLEDDLLVVNLEGPLVLGNLNLAEVKHFQGLKCGPVLWNKSLPKFDGQIIYSLANNHFSDLGEYFSELTLEKILLDKDSFCGYGHNQSEARKPIYFEYQGERIGHLSISETQFGEATYNSPGTANFGPWVYEKILEMKKLSDFIVISIHAGAEDFPWPLPFWQDTYRSFISYGVNLVIAHHPHIPQGFEHYQNGFIAYGLGNFGVKVETWENTFGGLWSLGVKVEFLDKKPRISILYLEQKRKLAGNFSSLIQESKDPHLIEFIENQNKLLNNPKVIHHIWKHLSKDLWNDYLKNFYLTFFQKPTFFKSLKRISRRALKSAIKKSSINDRHSDKRLFYHAISCETHRQIATLAMTDEVCIDSNLCNQSKQEILSFRTRTSAFRKSF